MPQTPATPSVKSVGVVGARGFVGAELVALVAVHPLLRLGFVSSRERAGEAVAAHVQGVDPALRYVAHDPAAVAASGVDAVVLALPNDKAAPFVVAIDAGAPEMVVVDLSADYRFDAAWTYGLPELARCLQRVGDDAGRHGTAADGTEPAAGTTSSVATDAPGARRAGRIANPGCYATAMQLAIAPMRALLDGPVQCFGVSGWSGAGTTPSPRNDPEALRDNLMPYALAGHVHEREVARHLHAVEFMPHVAPHYRGLTVTANLHLRAPQSRGDVLARYEACYADEPLVHVVEDAPWLSRVAGRHHAEVGGFTLSADGRRLVVVAALDNLLKGAATQAMQNLNLAFGLPELAGIGQPGP